MHYQIGMISAGTAFGEPVQDWYYLFLVNILMDFSFNIRTVPFYVNLGVHFSSEYKSET